MSYFQRLSDRFKREWKTWDNCQRIAELAGYVKQVSPVANKKSPVIIFNASTRLEGLSLNAAYSLLAGYGLQIAGTPLVHLVCNRGLSKCVLGTNKNDVHSKPPCRECINNSDGIFIHQEVRKFEYSESAELKKEILHLRLEQLLTYKYRGYPIGEIILPSLRWILRRHNLFDDDPTRFIAREYILSAINLLQEFERLLDDVHPQAVVVFNGMFYPEAVARMAAMKKGLPVITHEVGMQPFSAFFTLGDATAYPVVLPENFKLTNSQDKILDEYLSKRFQGDFITAGIKFWPEMHKLGPEFWQKATQFKQFAPIFTNVVFDTSQAHANVVFPHMFAWLDLVLEEIRAHPDTLFVIRAHPDELRPGKESCESVAQWVEKNAVAKLANVTFIRSNEMISSYELIEHAKFVMVYNSTVGLEAAIKGKPVLCAGKARYTQVPTVYFPETIAEFQKMMRKFLKQPVIPVPEEFIKNARLVLYSQLFMASLSFADFIESDGIWNGFVRIKDFPFASLNPDKSSTMRTVVDGILRQQDFLLKP
jgi:hypothetical protein